MQRDLTKIGKWKPAALFVLGVVAILLAAGVGRITPGHGNPPAAEPGIVLRGPGDVAVVTKAYERARPAGGTPTPASTPSPCSRAN